MNTDPLRLENDLFEMPSIRIARRPEPLPADDLLEEEQPRVQQPPKPVEPRHPGGPFTENDIGKIKTLFRDYENDKHGTLYPDNSFLPFSINEGVPAPVQGVAVLTPQHTEVQFMDDAQAYRAIFSPREKNATQAINDNQIGAAVEALLDKAGPDEDGVCRLELTGPAEFQKRVAELFKDRDYYGHKIEIATTLGPVASAPHEPEQPIYARPQDQRLAR